MTTMQQVVDLARVDLSDTAVPYLHSDEMLLAYLNAGIDALFKYRPDEFIGQYSTYLGAEYALDDDIPVRSVFKRALADYIMFRAETRNDPDVLSQRAAMTKQLFAEAIA